MQAQNELVKAFWKSKFFILLITLLALILLLPLSQQAIFSRWLVLIFYKLVIIAVILSFKKHVHYFKTFISIAIITLTFNFIALFYERLIIVLIGQVFFSLFSIITIIMIFTEIVITKSITRDTLYGAISLYLLIGITFGVIYYFIESIQPGAFLNTIPGGNIDNFNLIYFSFITLTTIGFGDIVAISPFAKAVVMIESATGIFYLALLVSRLVATFRG